MFASAVMVSEKVHMCTYPLNRKGLFRKFEKVNIIHHATEIWIYADHYIGQIENLTSQYLIIQDVWSMKLDV